MRSLDEEEGDSIVKEEKLFKVSWGGVFAQCLLVPLYDNWAYVTDVYVHPFIRGKGYANIPLSRMTSFADRHGISLVLKVQKYGRGGLKRDGITSLYRSHGFRNLIKHRLMTRRPQCQKAISLKSQHGSQQTAKSIRMPLPQKIIKYVLI